MKRFALLGAYQYGNRNNIEVIAMSDDCDELTEVWNAIKTLNQELEGKDREIENPKASRIIETTLSSVDIVDEITGFVHEINILGLFIISPCITVRCGTCGKVLYDGPENDTKHLIIYCVECGGSA